MDPKDRPQRIEQTLRRELAAVHVAVEDLSARHAGHPGAKTGAGHFSVLVVSERFRGLSAVAAQRLVHDCLGNMMSDDIHALEMRTLTPEAWQG